jgi:hypothetical protein
MLHVMARYWLNRPARRAGTGPPRGSRPRRNPRGDRDAEIRVGQRERAEFRQEQSVPQHLRDRVRTEEHRDQRGHEQQALPLFGLETKPAGDAVEGTSADRQHEAALYATIVNMNDMDRRRRVLGRWSWRVV